MTKTAATQAAADVLRDLLRVVGIGAAQHDPAFQLVCAHDRDDPIWHPARLARTEIVRSKSRSLPALWRC